MYSDIYLRKPGVSPVCSPLPTRRWGWEEGRQQAKGTYCHSKVTASGGSIVSLCHPAHSKRTPPPPTLPRQGKAGASIMVQPQAHGNPLMFTFYVYTHFTFTFTLTLTYAEEGTDRRGQGMLPAVPGNKKCCPSLQQTRLWPPALPPPSPHLPMPLHQAPMVHTEGKLEKKRKHCVFWALALDHSHAYLRN